MRTTMTEWVEKSWMALNLIGNGMIAFELVSKSWLHWLILGRRLPVSICERVAAVVS